MKITFYSSYFFHIKILSRVFLFQDAYLNDLNEIRKLFHLLVILVNNGCLQESELKELLIEIKSVLRTIIKRMTEVNRKHKSHAESSSLPNEDSKKNETSGELILNTKDIFIHNMNFLMESLHFLEVTCEVTSWHLCTNNKGKASIFC